MPVKTRVKIVDMLPRNAPIGFLVTVKQTCAHDELRGRTGSISNVPVALACLDRSVGVVSIENGERVFWIEFHDCESGNIDAIDASEISETDLVAASK